MKKGLEHGYDSDASFDEMKLIKGEARLKKLNPHQYEMYPYNSIGLIISYFEGQPGLSTGSLLSSNIVLMSAHSIVFSSPDNEIVKMKPKDIVFYPHLCGKIDSREAHKIVDYRLRP